MATGKNKNASKKANTAKAKAAAPAQQQAVAYLTDAQGQRVALSAADFGNYVANKYKSYPFIFKSKFFDYVDSHVMKDVRAKLLSGMDEISVDYVLRLEKMLHNAYIDNITLSDKDAYWSDSDRYLFKRNEEWVERGQPPFLQQVNLEWSSIYTNFYGLYDVLPITTTVKRDDLVKQTGNEELPAADDQGMVEVNYQDRLNGRAVVDVGGYIGDTVVLFRDLFSKSKIHVFEPVSGNFKQMSETLAAEIESGRVIPVQKGLGDKETTMRISGCQGEVDSTASLVNDFKKEELYEDISITTLDSYVVANKLNVGVLKIDVEGFEPEIVRGALKTIKEQKPLLVIAIYHHAAEFYELKPFLEELNLGYKFCIRRSALCNPSTELVLIGYPD